MEGDAAAMAFGYDLKNQQAAEFSQEKLKKFQSARANAAGELERIGPAPEQSGAEDPNADERALAQKKLDLMDRMIASEQETLRVAQGSFGGDGTNPLDRADLEYGAGFNERAAAVMRGIDAKNAARAAIRDDAASRGVSPDFREAPDKIDAILARVRGEDQDLRYERMGLQTKLGAGAAESGATSGAGELEQRLADVDARLAAVHEREATLETAIANLTGATRENTRLIAPVTGPDGKPAPAVVNQVNHITVHTPKFSKSDMEDIMSGAMEGAAETP